VEEVMLGIIRLLVLVFVACGSTGCATILAGKSQTVTVATNPPGARCELIREGRVIGTVDNTPGAITLIKSKHDIDVICRKDGFSDGKGFGDSGLEGATFGNIILGGLIGWGVDSAVGADNKYPEVMTVNLVPSAPVASSGSAAGKFARPVSYTPKDSGGVSKDSSSTEKRLERLKKLKDEGVLTDEEYQKKRSELINQL
jgi:hypothetical protein